MMSVQSRNWINIYSYINNFGDKLSRKRHKDKRIIIISDKFSKVAVLFRHENYI